MTEREAQVTSSRALKPLRFLAYDLFGTVPHEELMEGTYE